MENTFYFSDSDNGVIFSDPDEPSSDIIISVNDGVAFDIGKMDSDAQFSIFYNSQIVHNVNKNGDVEAKGKIKVGETGSFMKNLTGGSIAVGADNSANDLLDMVDGIAKITYTFPNSFSSIPHVTATARHPSGTSFGDTFSVTIQSISTSSVTFLIQRLDSNNTWGMNLQLDWWGFDL